MISVKNDFILSVHEWHLSPGHLDLSELQEMRLFYYFHSYLYIFTFYINQYYLYLVLCSCLLLHHRCHNYKQDILLHHNIQDIVSPYIVTVNIGVQGVPKSMIWSLCSQ